MTTRAREAHVAPVLHVMDEWLAASEGFVFDLVSNVRRPGVVVALASLCNTERFPHGDVRSLHRLPRYVRPKKLQLPAMEAALELIARRRRAAIVHVHHGYALQRVVGPARRCRLPVVLSLHGHDVTGYLEKRPDAYRSFTDVVSAVVVPSNHLVEYARRAGFDRYRIRVQPSGIDLSCFSPSPVPKDPPTALFVGRFVPKKGLDVLARAWPAVQARIPEARLVVCGFGQQEALARSIPGNVTVHISPDRTVVSAQMRDCRVVVSPSHAAPDDALETLLVVNVEAQASGRPVVTTRHGAIPEFVAAGRSALLVEENDDAALADALVALLDDHALARCMGAHGPAVVAHLDVRATAARMDALYDELLARS
jgi:colanic acid/amylovoran biosynthesis glycosyltransferase